MMKNLLNSLISSFILFIGMGLFAQEGARLLKQPTLSKNHLAFVFGGDIWVANRDGLGARRLTTHAAEEEHPHFSPDGTEIAFTAAYDGNRDVYVISVEGGQPRRLTYHPFDDVVSGWSPDGSQILFSSAREIKNSRSRQLFQIARQGGFPQKVMEAVAFEGCWNPDGVTLAYRPTRAAHGGRAGWHLHRGGATPPIWIINPETGQVEKIPHDRSNDLNPMWNEDKVLFISDRDNVAANLYEYDRASKQVRKITEESEWSIQAADVYDHVVVYEVAGHFKQLDLKTGSVVSLSIPIHMDSPQLRPRWKSTSDQIESIGLSKTGKRAVITARGDIYTVPLKDGSTRNLTATTGLRERDAEWSNDGQLVAYLKENKSMAPIISHDLVIEDQKGLKKPRIIQLEIPGYLYLLKWSPNDEMILLRDNHLNLYLLKLAGETVIKVDTDQRRAGVRFSFSSDSRWLAYTYAAKNHFSQIKLYDIESGKSTLITDGMSHADNPVFAKDHYLYFTASTNTGPQQVGLDMSSQERSVRSAIYAAVLAKDGKSPLLPITGDEEEQKEDSGKETKKDSKKAPSEDTKLIQIDLEGLLGRVVALPIPERNYDTLAVAEDGALFYVERRQPGTTHELPGSDPFATGKLNRFDFEKKESSTAMEHVGTYTLSPDGKKLLIMTVGGQLVHADAKASLEAKPLDVSGMKALIDPRKEWRQIFDEVWWMEYEFFYDADMHGSDWKAVYDKYLPLLDHVVRREDLNTLMVELIGELEVGHNNVGGGDIHQEPSASIGLLGADFSIQENHYRIDKIYHGENWNPFLKAPLAVPGLGVKEGDFVLAINGVTIDATDNLFAHLEGTLGTQVTLTINSKPDTDGARDIVVEPISRESQLRHWDWVESNRRYVEKATDGKVAYVYLPNTAGDGFRYFNRMFFAQIDKKAVIIDERRNGGGQAANYITDVLNRTYLSGWKDRDGLVFSTPGGAIYGPKVMLIDQDAGSGGDYLPWSFKRMGLGTLVGKRTWGGLIGISTNPGLIDGGFLTVPYFRFFTPDNEWRVENEGVSPDIDVDLEPDQVNQGKDSQLDAAIKKVLADLKAFKPVELDKAPPMPTELGK